MSAKFFFMASLTMASLPASAETRAVVETSAHKYPPNPGEMRNVVHTYQPGDVLVLKHGSCAGSVCQVVTPSGEIAWVSEYKTSQNPDLEVALADYTRVGFEHWDKVDIAVWYSMKEDRSKIDGCAIKIAHGVAFDRQNDWPAYCNKFEHTREVRSRVADIVGLMKKFSQSELKKIRAGTVWIGANKNHVLASWGTPADINTTTTSSRKREQWVYDGDYVYLTNGVVTAIQN